VENEPCVPVEAHASYRHDGDDGNRGFHSAGRARIRSSSSVIDSSRCDDQTHSEAVRTRDLTRPRSSGFPESPASPRRGFLVRLAGEGRGGGEEECENELD
jgi:hypothetical protein